jgi:uncharacterized damage-inducible protein DinB
MREQSGHFIKNDPKSPFTKEHAMPTAKDIIRNQFQFADMLVQAYVGDLNDADLFVRSVPGSNHIAWQMGHFISSAKHILESIGHEAALPQGFAEAHTKETSGIDDPAKFSTKAEYLRLYGAMQKAALDALDKTPDAELDKPSPERMREYAPTVAAVFMLLGNHPVMHAGQFVPIRRKLGKPALF